MHPKTKTLQLKMGYPELRYVEVSSQDDLSKRVKLNNSKTTDTNVKILVKNYNKIFIVITVESPVKYK